MNQVLLSPEARVLLLLLEGDSRQDRLAATLQEPHFDWNRLVSLAEKENATALLWPALRALPAGSIPSERAGQLSRLAQVTGFRMLYLEQRLLQALDTLSAAGIEVLLLKGAALASTVYGSFGARPMHDLDLLVRSADAARAWDLMRQSGWVPSYSPAMAEFYDTHHHLVTLEDANRTGLGLELHTAITPGNQAVRLSADAIWERARPIEIKGRHALVPCTEHHVLHTAIHFAWSHMMASAGWRTFRDLQQLATQADIDWDDVVRRAEQVRAQTCCFWTLKLARSLAGLVVPDHVLAALRPPYPLPMLRLLERHYAGSLFLLNHAACPSVRLRELLWTGGMAPRWSGHGHVRPWDRGAVWAAAEGSRTWTSIRHRIAYHYTNAHSWARYLRAIFSSSQPLAISPNSLT